MAPLFCYMTPIAVLNDFIITHTTITTASHNIQLVPARSDDLHGFDIYQSTILGAGDATICTLVTVPISSPHIVKPSSHSSYSITTTSSTTCFFVIYQKTTVYVLCRFATHSFASIQYGLPPLWGEVCYHFRLFQYSIRYLLLLFRLYINPHLVDNYTPDNLLSFKFFLVFSHFGIYQ